VEIIISFLIGLCIFYIGVSTFIWWKEDINEVPKFFRPGVWIFRVAFVIFIAAFLMLVCYLAGHEIYKSLIK
jgi:uncharacterized membrane protein